MAWLLAAAVPASAQIVYFGQNKIQHNRFRWQILQGEHVHLYHYPEEAELARHALVIAEESYAELRLRFRIEPSAPVPLVLYTSHHHFSETNLVPYILPEGVAGFTEYARGRVALPFTGSYADLRDVLRHEMVHVFQRAELEEIYRRHPRGFDPPPLWLSEGLAEYWSGSRAAAREILLRDATLSGRLPTVEELTYSGLSYAVYVFGHSLAAHLAQRFGDDALLLLYESLPQGETYEAVFRAALGEGASELTDSWHQLLRERYYPLVTDHPSLEAAATRLTGDAEMARMPVVVAPARAGDPPELVYLSARGANASLRAAPLGDPPLEGRLLLEGEKEERFESFHPGQSRLDVSAGRRVAFVSKLHDRDALYVLALDGGQVQGPFHFRNLIAISSPSWSPDGTRVVFSALDWEGLADLYLFEIAGERLQRLTRDRFHDTDPAWSPDGGEIVFASDRGATGVEGFLNLWTLSLETGGLRPLTNGRWNDTGPRWSPGGRRLLYASDRDGVPNLRVLEEGTAGDDAREDRELTRIVTGTLEAAWMPDGRGVVFAAYQGGRFAIHRLRQEATDSLLAGADALDARELAATPATGPPSGPDTLAWAWPAPASSAIPLVPYRTRYQLDVAQGAVAYDLAGNFGEGVQAVLSDDLNDRLLLVGLSHSGESFDDFFTRLSFGVSRVDLSRRLNYAVGVFHYVGDFVDQRDLPFFERRLGARFGGAYPFSRYDRIEVGQVLAHSDKSAFLGGPRRRRMIGESEVGWVRDNAQWGTAGPRDGGRTRLALAAVTDLGHAQLENVSLVADARRYLPLGRRTSLALRASFNGSQGTDPELFALGGSWSLRGYRRNSLVGTRALLLNQELRFPLVAPFTLFLPPGRIGFPGIEGALLFDAGNAWEEHDAFPGLVGSYGFGARVPLGGVLALRFDYVWTTDFEGATRGPDLDFFFGWDY